MHYAPRVKIPPRPFRFGVIANDAASGEQWAAKARRAEELGYDVLLITDHMGSQLSPFPALAAAAAVTTRIRLASFVFANDYRNPVMLAKEAATLDVLSGGRLELGIGAGWSTRDYEQLGIPYDPPAVRVDRMIEATRLIARLWTEDVVEHSGRHYTLRGARVLPKPIQRPRPPIMVGGGGPRILGFAARHAEIVALAPRVNAEGNPLLRELSMRATAQKVARAREAAGVRARRIELNVIVFDAGVAGHGSLLQSVTARLKATASAILESPYFLFGSREEIRAALVRRRERLGISYVAIPDHAMEALAPVIRELRGT
jgi:probable F420-dependent oxidoreductase